MAELEKIAVQPETQTIEVTKQGDGQLKPAKDEDLQRIPTRRITLERTSDLQKSFVYILAFLYLETSKQVSNFALSKTNEGVYPVSSSFLVVLVETFKLFLIYAWVKVHGIQTESWSCSARFGFPAVCYFFTNLIYLVAITVVSPPIWMVLIQTRTLYTAAAYKIIFGREVTPVQVLGCIFVVCSVVMARYSAIADNKTNISFIVLVVSQVAALLSTVASVSIELLLKNDGRSFCEQQWWLYIWTSFLSCLFMLLKEDLFKLFMDIKVVLQRGYQLGLLCLSVVSTALAGICIPLVVKNLDTIVKDYLSASNNLLLSILTAAIFPAEFTLTWSYLLSLSILVSGIWLYEKKRF